jgi:hypothetical protein
MLCVTGIVLPKSETKIDKHSFSQNHTLSPFAGSHAIIRGSDV